MRPLTILRVLVGGVFVAAGAMKIVEPAQFATDIANYRLLPYATVNLAAITLPWIEVVAGLLLVTGVWTRASALVVTGLCVVFLAAIAQALARGLDVRCGCFGTVEARRIGIGALATDIVFLVSAAWVWWRTEE